MAYLGEYSVSKENDVVVEGCRSGKTLIVAAALIEMSAKCQKEVLTRQCTDKNGEIFSPFLIAVRNGYLQLVRLLLTMFSIDSNDKCHVGTVSFDGYLVEGATPLWCAAGIGNYDLVKLLLDHDAKVNQCTLTNSSPLRAACFCGKLSIVKLLIDSGADITISNRYQNTCLMVASYRGHLEVVEHLLANKSDPNIQASCGGTALHFAVDGSQLDIVKLLVQYGADVNIANSSGLTAPMSSADACNADMIEFFIGVSAITTSDKIMLLELLGASFANDKDHQDTDKTYHYLYLAMLMRNNENIFKCVLSPIPAYGNRVECQTISELLSIRNNQDALYMESLIVRERILGTESVVLSHPIIYRGAVYADRLQFNRSIALWLHALNLKQKNSRSAHADLFRFAEVFSQMVLLREEIEVNYLVQVLQCCLKELIRCRNELEGAQEKQNDMEKVAGSSRLLATNKDVQVACENAQTQLEGNIYVMLYLLLVVTKTVKTPSDSFLCGKTTYQFVKHNFRDRKGRTPLHLVLDETTPVDDFHVNVKVIASGFMKKNLLEKLASLANTVHAEVVKDVCSFPDAEVAKFLLSCGSDPNAVCHKGNSPLHIVVQYAKPISDFMTLHTAIIELLEAGAHPDMRNTQGETALDLATTGVAEIILKKESKWTLACFAAKVVKKHNIPYIGQVPETLEKFIEMH